MDAPGGAREPRFGSPYGMGLLGEMPDMYGAGRPPSSLGGGSLRPGMQPCPMPRQGVKRTSDQCYDERPSQSVGLEHCGMPDIADDGYASLQPKKSPPSNGKKTKGRVKIKMEYIDNKLRRYTTFSKRKTGIMKKAYELSTLTGTQVMLLVASETGHVYTFATRKLQPMITSDAGKRLIQTCLNSPDPPTTSEQRMAATGFEETELTYNVVDEDMKDQEESSKRPKLRQKIMTEKKYTKEAMLKALEAVERGASTSAAAREFNVPRTTLLDKVNGRSLIDCSKGPPTVLTEEEEGYLENWIIFMADSGFPVSKEQLQDSVSILIKKLGRKNPFQNSKPGRHWYAAFIKRHPNVGHRVSQNLTQTRAQVTEADIRTWFREIEQYFCDAQLEEASQDPRRIFNCDESAFFLSPVADRVLAKRGSKNVYNIVPSGERECVTVLLTANAAGELLPPMVLFKLKTIPPKISNQAPSGWGIGHTAKGWMTGEAFYEYITNVFFPWIKKSAVPLPIIFFLDGHCSHTTLPLSNFCRQNGIILISLFPNATHLLQPMDVSVFRPLKRIWKKTVYDWRNHNQFVKLKKEHFCPLLEIALKQLDPNVIVNGFRKSGLSPFNADNVDYSKCVIQKSKQSIRIDDTNTNLPLQSDKNAHFRFFESQISPSKLKAFNDNKGPIWYGNKSLEGLFTVWRQMKNQIYSSDVQASSIEDVSNSINPCENVALPITEEHLTVTGQNNYSLFEQAKKKPYKQTAKTLPIDVRVTEPMVTCEDQTTLNDFGNFTGFSDILDSNYSLNNISTINSPGHKKFENQKGNDEQVEQTRTELFEVIDGELINVTPDSKDISSVDTDIPIFLETSLPLYSTPKDTPNSKINLSIDADIPIVHDKFVTSKNAVKDLFSSPNVIRTTGSKPIYLTPHNKIMTSSVHCSDTKTIKTHSTFATAQRSLTSDLTVVRGKILDKIPPTVVTPTKPSRSVAITFPDTEIPYYNRAESAAAELARPPTITNHCPQSSYLIGDEMSAILSKITTTTTTATSSSKIMTAEDVSRHNFPNMECLSPQVDDTQPSITTEKQSCGVEGREQSKKYYGDLVVPTPFKDALFWPEPPAVNNVKQKVKIPSVITSDRWKIFAQKKNDVKIEKEKKKVESKKRKESKLRKPCTEVQKRITAIKKATSTRKLKDTEKSNKTVSKKDWYCGLCQTCAKLDMIQCLSCNVWYHTSCAEVRPTEISFHCLNCKD